MKKILLIMMLFAPTLSANRTKSWCTKEMLDQQEEIINALLSNTVTRSIHTVSEITEYNNNINSSHLVVVKFYMRNCSACTAIKRFYFNLTTKYPNVTFLEINISSHCGKQLLKKHKILWLPTIMFFKDGKLLTCEDSSGGTTDRIVGIKKRWVDQQIQDFIDEE